MTTGKRALIVDDSRSARVILSRMLEQHGLAVDTAESAEQALDYLQQHRPDVIFMDHLMPGMDGFQAVQAIKSDPQTATIPLMMYTSQEGELYVSQARALGAIGVLPKTVRPVDVSRVLYQLHLLPDRRQDRTTLFRRPAPAPVEESVAVDLPEPQSQSVAMVLTTPAAPPAGVAVSPEALSDLSAGLRQSVQQLVKDQLAEQRRFMLATFEAFARRMGTEFREHAQRPAPPPPPPVEIPVPEPEPRPWWPIVVTGLLAAVPAVLLVVLYWRALDVNHALSERLAGLEAQVGHLANARPAVVVPAPVAGTDPAAAPDDAAAPAVAPKAAVPEPSNVTPVGPDARAIVEYVPYGDVPFGGTRLDRVRSIAAAMEASHKRGRIVLEYTVGDFCLSGNPTEGFEVADPSLPLRRCDIVGNPFDDGLSAAQRQSVDFANFAATLSRRSGGAITVDAASAGRRGAIDYPEQSEATTAGSWNTVAAQNNRVDIRVVPAE
ncbi:MAG: response regulator [Steroidobacteraceae bacterium]